LIKSRVATYCQISDIERMDTPFAVIRTKRRRSHALRIVREALNGKYRFKIAGYYVDGKRVRKYFETRKAAETFVEAEQIRRENLGKRATHIDGALAEDALRASDILKKTPYTLIDAARFVAHANAKLKPYAVRIDDAVDAHVAAIERRNRSVTVNKLVDEFIQNRRVKGKSEIYLRDLTIRLRRFKSSMGNWAIADITCGDVDQWLQSLDVGAQSQNNFRAVLSAMWTFAVRRGYATTNVIQLVDKTSVVRDHIPTFSVGQLTELLSAAAPEYVPVLAIGAFAGLRPEEIAKLTWEDLDFNERTIRVNASAAKTRKKRFAEISDNLAAWLKPYAGRTGPIAPANLQKLRRASMKAANIEKWPPDVLRHSFASAHYAFHRDPARTAVVMGHRDQNMLLTHYRDIMKPSESAHYWTLAPDSTMTTGKLVRFTVDKR
jgi:integrase/recombinase XerD